MSTQEKNSPTEQKTKRYVFAQRPDDDYTCIKLVEGDYKDIIYKYVNYDTQEFIDYIGDILIELVEEQLATGKMDFLKFEDVNE